MIFIVALISSLFSSHGTYASQSPYTPQPLHVHIYNTSSAESSSRTQATSTQQTLQEQNQQQTQVQTVESWQAQLTSMTKKGFQKTHTSDIWNWLQKHTFISFGLFLVFVYGTVWLKIASYKKKLNSLAAWNRWQEHTRSLPDLMTQSQQLLEQELLFEIQQRYMNPSNPTDYIAPLVQFSITINQELRHAQALLKLYNLITSCKLSKLFHSTPTQVAQLEQTVIKLTFILRIFTIWCAQENSLKACFHKTA